MTARDDLRPLHKLVKKHRPYGRTLVLGSRLYEGSEDRRGWYRDAVGLDMLAGPGVDLVHDLEHPLPEAAGTFDHIDCCSVLEHVARPWVFAENAQNALRPSGSIVVSVPFVWRLHAYPSDYWRMTAEALQVLFWRVEWQELRYTANGALVDRPPSWRQADGKVIFERCELLGFGRLAA